MAEQNDESPRRVRARLEKEDLLEALAAEIIERKALDLILDSAEYEDVPLDQEAGTPVATVEEQSRARRDEGPDDAAAARGEAGSEDGRTRRRRHRANVSAARVPQAARCGANDSTRIPIMFDPLSALGDVPFEPKVQRYREYARQRQMTLGDLLLENRIIFLGGSLETATSRPSPTTWPTSPSRSCCTCSTRTAPRKSTSTSTAPAGR